MSHEIAAMKKWLSSHRAPLAAAVELDGRVRAGEKLDDAVTDMIARRFAASIRHVVLDPSYAFQPIERSWKKIADKMLAKIEDFSFFSGPGYLREAMENVGIVYSQAADEPYYDQYDAAWRLARKHDYWLYEKRPNPNSPVANKIYFSLGGKAALAKISANNYTNGPDWLMFKHASAPNSGTFAVRITRTGESLGYDTYRMEFFGKHPWSARGVSKMPCYVKYTADSLHADQLVHAFESRTGLELRT